MSAYSKIYLREDLKDYQLARLLYWQELSSKVPITKSDMRLIKILRDYGILIERYDDVSIVGYPTRYTSYYSDKEPDDITLIAINSEILK